MGMKTKEVGGGPATGLANDFVNFLQQGLQTGSFGAGTAAQRFDGSNPMGSTMGIAGVLNDLLMGGAGKAGGSMAEMINKDVERQAQAMRARYGASGGGSYGSSAAFGEALLRSEAAPKITQAVTGMQMSALAQLLPIMAGISQKGITQRETIAQQNPWLTAASTILPMAGQFMSAMQPNTIGVPSASGAGRSGPVGPDMGFDPASMFQFLKIMGA